MRKKEVTLLKLLLTLPSIFFLVLSTPTFANEMLTAQKLLTKLGYSPGPIDGTFGNKTKKALEKYYISIGEKYDGTFDSNELEDLRASIKNLGVNNVCNSSVNIEKTEGISKAHIETDFNSYFSNSIITDLPRFKWKTDGILIPDMASEHGNAEIKLIADFNNDGFDDIMIENYEVNIPPIFLISEGNGKFEIRNNLLEKAARRHIRKAVAADFNNDGLLDVAGFTTGDPYKEIRWPRGEQDLLLINEGGKTFREVKIPEWTRNDWNHGGHAADIDGDGLVDILPVSEEGNRRTGPIKNLGNDKFKKGKVAYSKVVNKELSSSVVSGDLNGDGHVDLVFALTKNIRDNFGFRSKTLKANTIHVIFGDGNFSFKDNKSISFGHHWLTPNEVKQNVKNQKNFRTASNPSSMTPKNGHKFAAGTSNVDLFDINNDGMLDILAGYWFAGGSLQMSSGFKVYINKGDCFDDQTNIFFPNQRINRETEPGTQTSYIHQFYFEDISGDKLPDLVLQMDGFMDFLSSKEPYHPNIFINNGSNVYLPLLKKNGPRLNFETYKPDWTDTKQRFEETLKSHFHSLGDFDGDGRSDFVFIKKNSYSSKLHVLLQRTQKEKEFEKERIASLREKAIGEYNVSFTLDKSQKAKIATGRLSITPDSVRLQNIIYLDKIYQKSNLNFIIAKIFDGNVLDLRQDGLQVDNFGECLTMKGIIQENAVFKNIVDERGPHSRDDCRNKLKLWPISLKIEEKIDLEAERQAKIDEAKRRAKLYEAKRQAKIKEQQEELKKIEEKRQKTLKLEALKKQSNDLVPVNFEHTQIEVSKREKNYQQVDIIMNGLSVGVENFDSYRLTLMIDYAEKSSRRGLTNLFRIQVSANDLIPEFALPNLEECKKITWKNTNSGIKLQFLLGNESEKNLCVLKTMYPEKRNFLGSLANALPEILEAGLAKDKEQLEAILLVLNDAQK